MTDTRQVLVPGPDHPITVEPFAGHVVVAVGDTVIAETDEAVVLRESTYPPVLYLPFADLNQAAVRANKQHTYCPYKGEASYLDIVAGDGTELPGAIWRYTEPYDAVADIAGRVAFYPDRVSITATPSTAS